MTRGTILMLLVGVGLFAGPAFAVDLELQVQAVQPTSINTVLYRVAGVDATTPGADANEPVTLSLTGLAPGTHDLTTSFGVFQFDVDSSGVLSVPAGQALTTDGATLTIQNTASFPDFTLGALRATSMPEAGFSLDVSEWPISLEYRRIDQVRSEPGADAATPIAFDVRGLVPGQRIGVNSSWDGFVLDIDEAGNLVARATNTIPIVLSGQATTVQNTVDMTITCAAEYPTTIQVVQWFWNSLGTPFATAFGGIKSRPGADATMPVEFTASGLAPNQSLRLSSTFYVGVRFQVQADGSLIQTTINPWVGLDGTDLVVHNTVDLDGFAIRGAKASTFERIYYQPETSGTIFSRIDQPKEIPGADVATPLGFDVRGMAPQMYLRVASTFGAWNVHIDENGELIEHASGFAYVLEPGNQIVIQNVYDYRFRVWSDDPLADDVLLQIFGSDIWARLIAPDHIIAGADFPAGVQFCARGLVTPIWLTLKAYELYPGGGVNRSHGMFRLLSDGTAHFTQRYAHIPAVQPLTPTKGYVEIDGGPNRMYVEIFPAGDPPTWVTPLGDNRTLLTSEVGGHVLSASAVDPDGEPLHYRWLQDGAEVPGADTSTLELGPLGLPIGSHTFTLEVRDCFYTISDSVVVTIENSPPVVSAGGGGTYEGDAQITLSGTVADYDGDELAYRWMLGDVVLSAGTASPPAGGAPVDLPGHLLDAATLGLGTHTIQLIVEDQVNAAQSREIEVFVQDTTAPTLAPTTDTRMLWPPNHKMVAVEVCANAADNSGNLPTLSVEVVSSEPAEFDGSGNFLPDHEIISIDQATGKIRLNLRAERAGRGDGRTYTIYVTATDAAGNESTAELTVVAPHDRRAR